MRVEVGREEDVAKWLKDRRITVIPPYVSMALVDNGRIVAVAVYNNYQDANIDLSVVTDGPIGLTRGHLRALFTYPFIQLKVNRVSARTSAENMEARRQIRRLGFKREGTHHQFYGEVPAMSYGLTREKCKWI